MGPAVMNLLQAIAYHDNIGVLSKCRAGVNQHHAFLDFSVQNGCWRRSTGCGGNWHVARFQAEQWLASSGIM